MGKFGANRRGSRNDEITRNSTLVPMYERAILETLNHLCEANAIRPCSHSVDAFYRLHRVILAAADMGQPFERKAIPSGDVLGWIARARDLSETLNAAAAK